MNALNLPPWRRSPARRWATATATLLPGLAAQSVWLDPELPWRCGALLLAGLIVACITHVATRSAHRQPLSTRLFWIAHTAAVLAALWPATLAWWPLMIGLPAAWIIAIGLGGSSVNPFPPILLALCLSMMLVRIHSGKGFEPPLISLLDALWVTGAWLAGGVILAWLKLNAFRALLAFILPTGIAFASGGIASTSLVLAAILASQVVSERCYLPANATGQTALAALAGLATALLWFAGAPPLASAFAALGVYGLSPWIERRSLAQHRVKGGSV